MSKMRTTFCLLLAMVLCFGFQIPVKAEAPNITGNNSLSTAYNYGAWPPYSSPMSVLEQGQSEAYYRFTIGQGERIYFKTTYDTYYEGMSMELLDENGITLETVNSPGNVVNPANLPFLPLNCDGTKSSQTYYIRVSRGSKYDINKSMYFTISFFNRIRTGQGTFDFSGSAVNTGNKNMDLNGVDSSILSLDLTGSKDMPRFALVTKVDTAGSLSKNLGGITHRIMPPGKSWYSSRVSSASMGMYNITKADNLRADQQWQFKYNCTAGSSSTMKKVKLNLHWEYDLSQNDYKIFIK